MKASQLLQELKQDSFQSLFLDLYQDESLSSRQKERYEKAVNRFLSLYGNKEVIVVSTSGRSEICGNHTDHQRGKVIAASLNLDAIAVCSPCENSIRIVSGDTRIRDIDVNDLKLREEEYGSTEALVRGVCARMKELDLAVGGFEAYVTSDVLIGSGMSSSACFENLIGTIESELYQNGSCDPVQIAKISQYAENVYFNKPCGLMDQVACAVGGLVSIDFSDKENPLIRPIDTDFSAFGLSLCILDTKGSHADLTDEYAAVPAEMKEIASCFGKEVLREVREEEFYDSLPALREKCGDRAVLRALHFFEEEKRVDAMIGALENKDREAFLKLICASGNSSYRYLQNVFSVKDIRNQSVSLALALTERLLENKGAWRVHGGGFSGTIQAFVPDDSVVEFKQEIEKVFGTGSCHVLKIRPLPTKRII